MGFPESPFHINNAQAQTVLFNYSFLFSNIITVWMDENQWQ